MKIFVTSDIHSFYTPLKNSLDEAGFEIGNENHLLVVCGDCFDRGGESCDVLKYLNNVPNKILVRGNHEDLLEECIERGYPLMHDQSNGTYRTICDLGGNKFDRDFATCCGITWNITKPLLDQMVNYYETEHYIFVHSWIACKSDGKPKYYIYDRQFSYDPDWRNAHAYDWSHARWGNPFSMATQGLNQTGKIIVAGHWHTSWAWAVKGIGTEWGEDACFDPYYGDGIIGLDACTAHSGKVNVLVLEDELLWEN